ncbi:recombinase RecT [Actinomadura litoris]|uniref:recombinase RecT n=1 Tax=Actinomadura litoris TaxID=2678616 RepID=UPI001FA6F793|nr:recombinase RecT [Actinomadura litoris]
MTTVSQAVEQKNTGPMAVVTQSAGWLGGLLPSHVDSGSFVSLAKAHLRKDPKLMQAATADPSGYMMALTECARLGLVPGDTFHIVPFKKKGGGYDFTGIVDYTGEIELIYRAGAVSSVKAEIVYAGDEFSFSPDMDRPAHHPDWFGERGDMVGVYAYAVMKDGSTSRVVVMSRAEVMRVKAVSKTAGFSDSPWKLWEDRMWLKTAIHQLTKWVPTSAEYRREQLRAAVEADNLRGEVPAPGVVQPPADEVVDGEVVDADAEAADQAAAENPLHYNADEITEGGGERG